ncbi:7128_t:CDS:2 [Paraglomus occultum]|uniref:7128_t:CDS:1 n=1 Tax=Paraglomus occultum TaxID=144539 RepID=A0A9N9ALD9_9GLOM|nr:7128_t:CDS:2 [Paraglomus occultum]
MSKNAASTKAYKLRTKNKVELQQLLEELKQQLGTLKVQKIAGGAASKLTKIREVRKDIAQVNTKISPARSSTKEDSCHSSSIDKA